MREGVVLARETRPRYGFARRHRTIRAVRDLLRSFQSLSDAEKHEAATWMAPSGPAGSVQRRLDLAGCGGALPARCGKSFLGQP